MSSNAWVITFALLLFQQGSAQLLEPNCGVPGDPIDGVRPSLTPWLALIRTDKHKCSGVLIHQQYVITAASCLKHNTQTIVRLGDFIGFSQQNENSNNFPFEEYYVETAIIHYLFNETECLNDLALLKLRRKVTYRPHIQPICLLVHSTIKAQVDTLQEFGATLWGLNEMRQFPNPKTDTISRLTPNECSEIFGAAPESTQICASFTSGASCLELGSPLGTTIMQRGIQRYSLYGIQSYGISKTCVFTDIMSYVDWIVENVLEVHIIN